MHQQDYYKGHAPLGKAAPADPLARAMASLDKLEAFAKSGDSGSVAKPVADAAPPDPLAKATAGLDKIDAMLARVDAMIGRKVDEVIGAMRKSQDDAAQGPWK